MVNSLILFKQITRKDIQISDFSMKVALYFTKCRDNDAEVSVFPRESLLTKPWHELKAMPGKARTVRRFCKICYQKNSKKLGRIIVKNCSKNVVTYCKDCAGWPFLCLECFNTTHRNILHTTTSTMIIIQNYKYCHLSKFFSFQSGHSGHRWPPIASQPS